MSEDFQPRQLSPVETLRHSMAHLMASAVAELYPGTKFGIGPHIQNGFYYDMEIPGAVTPEDLPHIEEAMRAIAKKNHSFTHKTLTHEEALRWAEESDQPLKAELLADIEGPISFYTHGAFTDMCAGPHVRYTKKLKHFKLTQIAGAYWRGDEQRPMLTRIYGVAFETKEELDAHLLMLEEAKKRDHRRLGKDLELFRLTQEYGPGLVLWLPNGAFMRKQIEDEWRKVHLERGYELLFTPHIAPSTLWDRSGHTGHYRDSMFAPMDIDGEEYLLKPMNCPFHIGVYNNRKRSYRELPMRLCELGNVYRYERSGVLHGLMRVRGFTQDDAHIFCTPETFKQELDACLDIAQLMYKTFGFPEFKVELSCRDPENTSKYLGSDEIWTLSEDTLAEVLDERGIEYTRIEGEAAFYGPKIDIKVVDTIGRSWQLTTIQLDFNLPERFDLSYTGADNQPHRPIMIHRALLGSIERFFGILIEHYAGDFPLWMSPVQARVLPLSEKFKDYGAEVVARLTAEGIRARLDDSDEKLGYKIRRAEVDKIPYAAVVGGREAESGTVGVRKRKDGDMGTMSIEDFIAHLKAEIEAR
ncbi:threonine--tRNA ligase [Myxococcota bacterium]|nr:threonine--tRNA ligase [Myxococcota bacterium]MBU1430042.1 threonine--tRNA ligase [Myxococcota bacterium]MBU1897791.1 threonine--tRNA ligase [Myxococcota bacterium]